MATEDITSSPQHLWHGWNHMIWYKILISNTRCKVWGPSKRVKWRRSVTVVTMKMLNISRVTRTCRQVQECWASLLRQGDRDHSSSRDLQALACTAAPQPRSGLAMHTVWQDCAAFEVSSGPHNHQLAWSPCEMLFTNITLYRVAQKKVNHHVVCEHNWCKFLLNNGIILVECQYQR